MAWDEERWLRRLEREEKRWRIWLQRSERRWRQKFDEVEGRLRTGEYEARWQAYTAEAEARRRKRMEEQQAQYREQLRLQEERLRLKAARRMERRSRRRAGFWAWVAAAVTFMVLNQELRWPLWIAILACIGAYYLVDSLVRPRATTVVAPSTAQPKPLPQPTETPVVAAPPADDTAQALITEGAAALNRLHKAGAKVSDPEMQAAVGKLCSTATRILEDIRQDPSRAMPMRRVLCFYLPNAASLAEGWRALETRRTPSPERMAQTRDTMRSLTEAFDRFHDELVQPQMQVLDLDLKVLNDALKHDLERL
jgi:hypothetical protein